MDQITLMQVAGNLEPGMAIYISRDDMWSAAEGSLTSLLFDQVRESDVEDLAKKMELNWAVRMVKDIISCGYTMHKLKLDDGDNIQAKVTCPNCANDYSPTLPMIVPISEVSAFDQISFCMKKRNEYYCQRCYSTFESDLFHVVGIGA